MDSSGWFDRSVLSFSRDEKVPPAKGSTAPSRLVHPTIDPCWHRNVFSCLCFPGPSGVGPFNAGPDCVGARASPYMDLLACRTGLPGTQLAHSKDYVTSSCLLLHP